MSDVFKRAAAIWVERQNPRYTNVKDVEFNTWAEGFCDTCGYEDAGLTFRYGGNGSRGEISLTYTDVGGFVAEVAAIAIELNGGELLTETA